jgi:hypothetical protein
MPKHAETAYGDRTLTKARIAHVVGQMPPTRHMP